MACPWTMTATLRPLLRGLLVEDGLSATLNIHWLLINTARTCFDVRFNTRPFSRTISWYSAWGEPAASHQYFHKRTVKLVWSRSNSVVCVAVCNRTYYGDVGKTYQLTLHKPREERLPFLCHLTFTANGHNHGDLVQVSIFIILWSEFT